MREGTEPACLGMADVDARANFWLAVLARPDALGPQSQMAAQIQMKNTDLRLQSINDFNELGETTFHFVRQDTTQLVVTLDLEEAKFWRSRIDHAILKFEEPDAKSVAKG